MLITCRFADRPRPGGATARCGGGWAILKTDSKAEAIQIATQFMELQRKHWPGFEGESEVRPMFEPGMGP